MTLALMVNSPAKCAADAERILTGYAGRPELCDRHLEDLLTDFAHLCADRKWDFNRLVKMAASNCSAERRP